MPACRGSARRSAATASSPRSSCCGSTRRSRAACWRFSPRRRRPRTNDAQDAAARQDPARDARSGEMAALGEVPFGRYYGSVDATPLFVMLAARLLRAHRRPRVHRPDLAAHRGARSTGSTARRPRRRRLRRVRAAERRRPDQPGLEGLARLDLPRRRHARRGADRAVRGAGLRLCGAGAARRSWRRCAATTRAADEWSARAERLRERFEQAFWCEELGTYALALDGDKRPCRVRTSNAGPLPVLGHRRARARRARVRHADGGRRRSRAGASARWPRGERATTRCRTTTARSGRTTTR